MPGYRLSRSLRRRQSEEALEKASDPGFDVMVARYFIEKNYRGILNLNMPKPAEHLSFAQLKVKRLGLQHYDNAIQEMRDPSGHLGFWLPQGVLVKGSGDGCILGASRLPDPDADQYSGIRRARREDG